MKQHTNNFKNQIKMLGRQLRGRISYGNTVLEEELYSIVPHFETNLLKSVMKQLDIECSVAIPKETVINYEIGLLVNGEFEWLNYGNYVVKEVEKQEDRDVYKILCYDKMLYSMKQNEDLGVTYPITIKNYLSALARKIGLTLHDNLFANQNMTIPAELYVGLEYTYRDILDEIAQATGSNICINNSDELEVRYFTDTNDTIDEEFLKDVNVKFGEKYGPVNSIVLSRSAESDNVYLRDEESIEENGLTEIKIVDNQIMNFNNRSEFLPGILNSLKGFYYYLNDFSSTGILYYEVCDLYNIQIGENTYRCAMLNDEVQQTMGIEENIHTDMPEQTETDYTKADKTDRRINETYLIVDKQNQTIESVVTNVTTQNNKISQIQQTVDSLNSKISDIADITTSQETNTGRLVFENINQSEPIHIEIKPLGEDISYLYPDTPPLEYPSNNVFIKLRTLRFKNTSTDEVFDWELPDDLLYGSSELYDDLVLDFDSQSVIVNKRCYYGYSSELGRKIVMPLATPRADEYSFPEVYLTDGDYEITLLKYDTTPYNAYLFVRLMSQNIYTTQFATRAELHSSISQTASEINLSVDTKLTNYATTTQLNSSISMTSTSIMNTVNANFATKENVNASLELKVDTDKLISEINASADTINLTSGRLLITSGNFLLDANGNITCNGGKIGGWTITNGKIYAGDGSSVKTAVMQAPSAAAVWVFAAGGSSHSGYSDCPFRVDKYGNLYATSANISGTITATSGTFQNCTITNSCTVPASTVSGTLATSTIPNLSASKITSGTMSASRISGGTMSGVTISSNTSVSAPVLEATQSLNLGATSNVYIRDVSGSEHRGRNLTITASGQVLRFRDGILTVD